MTNLSWRAFGRRTFVGGAAGAVAISLTACVGQGSTSTATTTDAASAAALPSADVTTTIKLWTYQTLPNAKSWDAAITRFNARFPNVKVDTTNIPYAEMTSKLVGSGISKGIPDGVSYNPADSAKLMEAGIIQEITPFWNSFADKGQFPDSVVWKMGDKVLSVQGYLNTTAIWYNKTILDKAGVTSVPTTIEEFSAALAKVKAAGYGGFLLAATPDGSGEFDFLPWFYGYGQNYGAFDKATTQTVFENFGRWIDAGYIPKDVTNNNEDDNNNLFASGKYAFVQNGNWNLEKARGAKYSFEWGVADFPAGPAGAHGIGGGEGFSIGAGTKYPALVYNLFEEMLLTREAQLSILKETGSLPTRRDAGADTSIQSNADLATYAKVVSELGARPNSPKISDYLNTFGRIVNSFVGGTIKADQAADQVVQQLNAP